jgi:hypothetical protein
MITNRKGKKYRRNKKLGQEQIKTTWEQQFLPRNKITSTDKEQNLASPCSLEHNICQKRNKTQL